MNPDDHVSDGDSDDELKSTCTAPSSESDESSVDSDEFIFENDDDVRMNEKLYNGSDLSVSEAVFEILDYFLKDSITKKALVNLLQLIHFFFAKTE